MPKTLVKRRKRLVRKEVIPSARTFLDNKDKPVAKKPAPPPVLPLPAPSHARFVYKGTLPGYLERSGTTVMVVRELTAQENECGGMFLIRAADGWVGHAREGELDR